MFLKSIKIFLLVFLFTFVSNEIKAQVSTYTFIDPCTKEVTLFSVPLQGGKTTIIFLNQVGSFDANDMSNGVFSNWVNQSYTTYRQTNPCSQQQGQVTQNQITAQIIGSTVQTIVSSILSSSQSQTTSTQVDGGGGDDAGGKGGSNSDNKKKNNNKNSQGNGSNNSNGTSTNSSSTQSGGQPQTGSGTSGSNGSTTGSQGNGSSTSGGGSTGSGNSTEGGSSTSQPPVGTGSGSGSSGGSGSNGSGSTGSGSNGSGSNGSGSTGTSGSGGGSSGSSGNNGGSGTTSETNTQKGEEVGSTVTMNNDAHNDNGSSGGGSNGGKGGKSGGGNARSNPIIVSSDITNAQNLNKTYTPIINIGTSRSSMTGLSSAGVTAMVWLNFQQYALSARYTKIHYNKSKKLKFVHNLNLTGVYTYGNYLGFLGYSGILNGGKWGITGFNVSGAVTIITEEKNGYYSPSITAFYTRPIKVNKKLIISPEIYVISTPLVYSSKEQVSISDRYFSGFIGSGFDYQISKRFKLNVNYKANLSTNPKFPILSFFLIGSKINL
jgi:hypothetical protein